MIFCRRKDRKAPACGPSRRADMFARNTGTHRLLKARPLAAGHRFGGAHTDDKLARLRSYLQAFTSALKNQGFVLIYIDAFAGSGDRTDVLPVLPLIDGDNAEPQRVSVPGSARLAIEVTPPVRSSCSYRKCLTTTRGARSALRRISRAGHRVSPEGCQRCSEEPLSKGAMARFERRKGDARRHLS
jgi:hypothetical protein